MLLLLAAGCSSTPAGPQAGAAKPANDITVHPRELIMAGGALDLCSSLSPDACLHPGRVTGPNQRGPARYGLDASGREEALALDFGAPARRAAIAAVLDDAATALGSRHVDAATLREALASRCVTGSRVRRCASGDADAPWTRLDDDWRSGLMAALEQPQRDETGRRLREATGLDDGRSPHGAAVMKAFVEAARDRADGGRPRIAVVTASAFDPFDPVDFYLDAVRQAGGTAQWWPVDSALEAAVLEGRGCAALPRLRIERLRLPGRARVYPDLVAQQADACADPGSLGSLPDRIDGIFFAGGDQWKLREAFFDDDDRPNAWLRALRARVASGDVVVGGTSAGSAVQSGGPMLSNGSPEQALRQGAQASPPPRPGCSAAGDCVGGLDEDAFTYWPGGGLGLAPGLVVDTHFSERGREARLVRLLADTGARWGIGVDETSALHLRWEGIDRLAINAVGASGGWVFERQEPACAGSPRAGAYYLAPGAVLEVAHAGGARLHAVRETGPAQAAAARATAAANALDPGALRELAQQLALDGGTEAMLATGVDGIRARLSTRPGTQRLKAGSSSWASVGPLTLAFDGPGICPAHQP
ncbi:type 1 glutamine amidotransferase family protein [Marilutibacter aestuarii]